MKHVRDFTPYMFTRYSSSSVSSVLSMMPLACYVTLVAAASYSYFSVGHWPSYGNPDPKNLPVRAVYLSATIATSLGFLCVLVWPVFIASRAAWKKTWEVSLSKTGLLYAIGAALWVVGIVRSVRGGGGIVDWILD